MPFIDNELYTDTRFSNELDGKPATSTLAKWRSSGDGPKFVLVGRTPFYRGRDINAWLERRTVSHTNALIQARTSTPPKHTTPKPRSRKRVRAADHAA